MAGITNSLANKLLNHAMGVEEYVPGMIYAGLLRKTSDVSGLSLGLGSEVIGSTALGELTGNGYTRYALSWGNITTGADGRAQIISTTAATFTASGGDWLPTDGVGLYDDGGSLCWFGYFDSPVTVTNGNGLSVGPFTLRLD